MQPWNVDKFAFVPIETMRSDSSSARTESGRTCAEVSKHETRHLKGERQMNQIRKTSAFGLALIAPVFSLVLTAQTGDPLMAIEQKLRSQIKLTRTLADHSDIITPGSVVELRVDGLMMYGVASPLPPSNTYKNGKIGQGMGGFGKDFAIGFMSGDDTTANDYPHRKFVAGEKIWVTGITTQKDGISFQLFSDVYDDVRYYANLKIPFPNKKEIPPADSVVQILSNVLAVVPSDGQSDQNSQAAAPAPTAIQAPQPVPVPMAAIAPPPPPADAPPPTIAIGQTKDQVSTAFGQPQRLAKIGVKEIFYYKDMKVTFTSGKVSNVE